MESTEPKTWEANTNGSKWLAENLKKMDQSVKRMLKLIEQDDSLANDEVNFQRKPEMIANVEEFHQLYRMLAERYDHMTKELCKSVTQGSGDSETGFEQDSYLQTPEVKVGLHKSDDLSACLDTSPSSPGADSVFSLKAGSESSSASSSDSDSESFVTSYLRTPLSINSQSMHHKFVELENELSAMKDKLQVKEADFEIEKELVVELKRRVVELETNVLDRDYKSGMLVQELEVAKNMLMGSDEEIGKLKCELDDRTSEGHELQNQLGLAREEIAMFEAQLVSEREHVLELEEMITRYNADLSDRDIEVWELKVALRDAEEQFHQEKAQLQSDLQNLSEKQACLEMALKKWELRTYELGEKLMISEDERMNLQRLLDTQVTVLREENNQLRIELEAQREHIEIISKDFDSCKLKHDMLMVEKDSMSAKADTLIANLSAREDRIHELENHLSQLRKKHNELLDESQIAQKLIDELKPRVDELQKEVDRQRVEISVGAEEKREAIRQLCFSLDHYRSGYQELRQAFVGTRRNVVMAA